MGRKRRSGRDESVPALHIACKSGQLSVVEDLLESCRDEILKPGENKNTALHFAVLSGSSDILEILMDTLDRGTQLDVRNADGDTPLHLAVMKANSEMVTALTAAGSDATLKNYNSQKTPLDLALANMALMQTLVEENLRRSDPIERLLRMLNIMPTREHVRIIALHFAVHFQHMDVLKTLLAIDERTKEDILINYARENDQLGNTFAQNALHRAVRSGDFSVFDLLPSRVNKDNIDRVDDNGQTPLHLAVDKRQLRMVVVLIASGASIYVKDKSNKTPADALNEMAGGIQHFDQQYIDDEKLRIAVLNFLIQVDDSVVQDSFDSDKTLKSVILMQHPLTKETALHAAVRSGKLELLSCCLKNIDRTSAASIDVPNSMGETPLHLSLKEGNVKMAELLLEFRADPKQIPLLLAVIDHGLLKKVLQKLEGDEAVSKLTEMKDNAVKAKAMLVALHVACEAGAVETVKSLLSSIDEERARALTMETDQVSGESAAHAAIRGKSIDVLNAVLNLNQKAGDCTNPPLGQTMHFALATGDVEMVKSLEKAGAQHSYDSTGAGRFHFAARSNTISTLEYLKSSVEHELVFEDEVNKATSEAGLTPLHYAAWNGNHDAVAWLLDNGAAKSLCTKDKVEEALPWQWAAFGSDFCSLVHILDYHAEHNIPLFPDFTEEKRQKVLQRMKDHNCPDYIMDGISWRVLCVIEDEEKFEERLKALEAGVVACAAAHGDGATNKKLANVLKKAAGIDRQRVVQLVNDSCLLEWAARRAEDNGSLEVVKPLVQMVVDLNRERSFDWQLRLAFKYAFDMKDQRKEFIEFLAACSRSTVLKEMIKEVVKEDVKGDVGKLIRDYLELHSSAGDRRIFSGENGEDKVEDDIPLAYWLAKQVQGTKAIVGPKQVTQPRTNNQTQQAEEKEEKEEKKNKEVMDLVKRVDDFAQRFVEGYPNEKGRHTGRSALHWATILKDEEIVRALREERETNTLPERCVDDKERSTDSWKNCKADEFDDYGKPPCWYARNDKTLLKFLKWNGYADNLKNDRQLFVDALNAILVGAALISSVSFAGFLNPPLGYSYQLEQHRAAPKDNKAGTDEGLKYFYVKNAGVAVFFVCNSFSFFCGMASALAGVTGVLPSPDAFNYEVVVKLRRRLLWAAVLLVFSIFFVLVAFAAAGFAGLPPPMRYQSIWTASLGGLLCFGMLYWFCTVLFHFIRFPAWLYAIREHLYSYRFMPKSVKTDDWPLPPKDPLEVVVYDKRPPYTRGGVPWEDGLQHLKAPVQQTVAPDDHTIEMHGENGVK